MSYKNTRTQGAAGVAAAIDYFTSIECPVLVPLFETQRYDLVVEIDGQLNKIECKHSTFSENGKSFEVGLRTLGGNQSWNGVSSKISSKETDYVFILANNRRWLIPAEKIEGKTSISVGHKAWNEYEV